MQYLGSPQRVALAFFFTLLSMGSGVCRAAEQPQPLSLREKSLAAENFVAQKLNIWQGRLNLGDWKIDFKLVRRSELKPKTLGNIHWDSGTRTASIRVLAVQDYKLGYPEMLQDMEFTVVHELVHLQLSSLPRSEASRSAEERAVNQITQALLDLARTQDACAGRQPNVSQTN